MKRVPILPTLVTLGNAFCGFLAIACVVRAQADAERFGYYIGWAGWLILLAMVLDALDGKVARIAQATSDFGAQLDSLCDVISFGVAPALIVRVLAEQQNYLPRLGLAAGAMFVLCAALRLARFNVETDASEESHWYFKGLPSPAAAGFVAGLTINIYELREEARAAHEFAGVAKALEPVMDSLLYAMPYVAIVLALLMISRIRYVHAINKMLRGSEPLDYLVKLMMIAILVVLTRPFSMPILIGGYILAGIVIHVKEKVFAHLPAELREHAAPKE